MDSFGCELRRKVHWRPFLFFLILTIAIPIPASATTLYVPDDYSTIQGAVDAASSGDTIMVKDGTYTENVDINKEQLTIKSKNGAPTTIVKAAETTDHVFAVSSDNVEINGFTVKGADYSGSPYDISGVNLDGSSDCTIIHNMLTKNHDGISLEGSSRNEIRDNTTSNNAGNGVTLVNSHNNSLSNISSGDNYHNGIAFRDSSDNSLMDCTIGDGVYLDRSNDNNLEANQLKSLVMDSSLNNRVKNNHFGPNGISLTGYFELDFYQSHTIKNNTISGSPIYYYKQEEDIVVPEDAGQVILVSSQSAVLEGLELIAGILLVTSDSCEIRNVSISEQSFSGIRMLQSDNNIVDHNDISGTYIGVFAYSSDGNTLKNNNLNDNGYGLKLLGSGGNKISRNEIQDGHAYGIWLANNVSLSIGSNNNTITENLVTGYSVGIVLQKTSQTTISKNVLSNNESEGLTAFSPENANIYLNNFSGNNQEFRLEEGDVLFRSPRKINYSYNQKPHKKYLGNYWSDYSGSDDNGDGIGDAPYSINSESDDYPLVGPFENYVKTDEEPVNFPDENLEQAIRDAIDKQSGDIYPSDLEGLARLYAEELSIEDLTGISYCTDLEQLVLEDNNISDLEPLSGLSKLQILDLYNNDISDLTPLSTLTNLEGIQLGHNDISKLDSLSNLTKLRWIDLYHNHVSNLSSLSALSNLQSLKLVYNDISSLSSLPSLPNLRSLDIRYNNISKLSSFPNLPTLRLLDLSHNQIPDIATLPTLPELEWLNLSSNELAAIDNISSLTELNVLYLDNNEIQKIDVISSLDKIGGPCSIRPVAPGGPDLSLKNNAISNIQPLVNNSGLGTGDEIKLQENYLDLSEGSEDMQNIQTLIDRGATVEYGSQEDIPTGYAILVAGTTEGTPDSIKGIPEKLVEPTITHNTNNAYRVLRNLGFNDDQIFYLNTDKPEDVDDDGSNEVDTISSKEKFSEAMDWAKEKVVANVPFVLYLMGHGVVGDYPYFYFGDTGIMPDSLDSYLNELPKDSPKLIVIDACGSGGFINSDGGTISASNRIVLTSTHQDQKWHPIGFHRWGFYSDSFWRNINKGLSVKTAFVNTGHPAKALLDDNGDSVGHSPNSLGNDGVLAGRTKIGSPGGDDLPLKRFTVSEYFSPGELRIYDSKGRITGIVNGKVKEEIPNSVFDQEYNTAVIFNSNGEYKTSVMGTSSGIYGLTKATNNPQNVTRFAASEIPISENTTHQYTADWQKLSQGEDGVTVKTDSDGDGTYEKTTKVGNAVSGTAKGSDIKREFSKQGITLDFSKVNSSGLTDLNVVPKLPFNKPSGINFIKDFYRFETTANFTGDVTVSMNYDDTNLSSTQEQNLNLYKINENGEILNITTSHSPSNNKITGKTKSFSYFAIGYGTGTVPSQPSEQIITQGPNPVPPEGCIFWLDLPSDTQSALLRIYDIDGRPLFEAEIDPGQDGYPSVGRWKPRDANGNKLGSGFYMYRLKVEHSDGSVIWSDIHKMVIDRSQ